MGSVSHNIDIDGGAKSERHNDSSDALDSDNKNDYSGIPACHLVTWV